VAPQAEGGLERGGGLREGPAPSSEVGTHPRGQGPRPSWRHVEGAPHPRVRRGVFVVWCLPLERDGGSPEGYRIWRFDGSLRLFGPWASFALVGT
jgi:hypothetical protein